MEEGKNYVLNGKHLAVAQEMAEIIKATDLGGVRDTSHKALYSALGQAEKLINGVDDDVTIQNHLYGFIAQMRHSVTHGIEAMMHKSSIDLSIREGWASVDVREVLKPLWVAGFSKLSEHYQIMVRDPIGWGDTPEARQKDKEGFQFEYLKLSKEYAALVERLDQDFREIQDSGFHTEMFHATEEEMGKTFKEIIAR
jgi:hypothetical protein